MADDDPNTTAFRYKAVFRQYLAAFIANITSFSFGTVMGWMAPMEPLLSSENPPVGTEPISDDMVSWIGSINTIGAFCGCFLWGISSDRLGRKRTAIIISIPIILGWLLTLIAQNAWWLLIARFIIGISCSGVVINNNIYVSEIAEDIRRGRLCMFTSIFLRAGWVFSYIIGTISTYHVLAAICLVIPVTFITTFVCMPETPIYLSTNGHYSDSRKSLLWFRGGNIVITNNEIEKQYYPNQRFTRTLYFGDLFRTKGVRKAFCISVFLTIGSLFSGEIAISTYTVRIFQESGSYFSPYGCMVFVGLLVFFFVIVSSILVDHAGRRVLLLTSSLVMAVSLFILASYLYYKNDSVDSSFHLIPIISVSVIEIFYAIGLGPVPFVVVSEIFPPSIRGMAASNIQMLRNLLSFLCIKTFPYLSKGLGFHICFLFYAVVCTLSAVFIFLVIPETKGKSVQTILKELNGEDEKSLEDSEYRGLLE